MKWHTYSRLQNRVPAPRLKCWLQDPGSLTDRLVAKSKGAFRVDVQCQHWGRARLDEARALGIDPRHRVLIREVVLYGNSEAWVQARSILPARSLDRSLRHLKRLGNKPLGAILFGDPHMQRGTIEITATTRGWGRRSLFFIKGQPLLVSEIFLSTFPL